MGIVSVLHFRSDEPQPRECLTACRKGIPMAAENVHEFNDANFQAEVESSDKPVLVDFWAEWCMPCRMLSPTIDKLASEHGDKIKVGKVNIDHNQQVSVNHGINAIPTVLIFKGGEVVKRFVGITSEGDLAAAIEELA